MTPTISHTFTYPAAASEFYGRLKINPEEWNNRPTKRRLAICIAVNRIFCDYLEACLLAAVSWVASYLVTGLFQCAASLHAHHAVLSHFHLL